MCCRNTTTQGIHQAIRLPGQHHDRKAGLYYNRHRYYDPVVGSSINQDPIGLAGAVNKSIYAINPMIFMDTLGLAPVKTCAERILKSADKLNNQEKYSYASSYGFGSERNVISLFMKCYKMQLSNLPRATDSGVYQ